MQIDNIDKKIPKHTQQILTALNNAGFKAYIVGGAVRDLLLGRIPSDFDITTNAHPEQVLEVCIQKQWKTVDQLGHNFGCVVIILEGEPTEVTTFRGERYDDSDAHRPSETWYCDKLEEDLSRRDFTVNAMALDAQGHLYDYFNGYVDLQKKILRTVGNSTQRYHEDALRMFRACRFVAQLGFTYVQSEGDCGPCGMPDTPYYLKHSYPFPIERCDGLSVERVRKEIEKLLISPYAGHGMMQMMSCGLLKSNFRIRENGQDTIKPLLPESLHLLGLPQNPRFHLYDTWEHTLLALDNSPRQLAIRWALLLHDLGKGMPEIRKLNKENQPSDPGHEALSAVMAKAILTRLNYTPKFIQLVTWLVAEHMRFAPMLKTGEKTLLRWVRAEATSGKFHNSAELTSAYEQLVEVFLADMGATHARDNHNLMTNGKELGKQVVELAQKHMPIAKSDLVITGHDLLKIVPQNKIKDTFDYLLQRVQSGNLPNEQNALLNAVQKNIKRHKNLD